MSTFFPATPSIGLEDIQRAALIQIAQNLNDMIDTINTEYATKDVEFSTAMGQVNSVTEVEHIPTGSFHEGHRPSLIEADMALYPNVSVMAYQAMPGDELLDQLDTFNNSLYIEAMVKSPIFTADADEVKAETIVNRRIQRMTDAIKRVITADITLGGTQFALQDPPTVNITDAFIRRAEKSRGDRWLWQGSRVEYTIKKYSNY